MILNEKQSWEYKSCDLKVLKSTGFYKSDAELRKLVQRADEVLMKIIPSSVAHYPEQMSEDNLKQWSQFRSLSDLIDSRIKINAALNKILIVYFAKCRNKEYEGREIGCKEEYARELSNALFWKKFSAETLGSENLSTDKLKEYSTIIFCSCSDIGTNKVTSLIVKYFEQLKDKKVVLFTCRLTNVSIVNKLFNKNKPLDNIITPEIRKELNVFHVKYGVFDLSDEKIFEPIIEYCSQNIRID